MRAAGVRLGVGELLSAHRALSAVDPADRDAAYFALRATLCSRHEDLLAFDAAFAEWFRPAPLLKRPRRPRSTRRRGWRCRAPPVPSQARPLAVEGAEGGRAVRLVGRRAAARQGLRRLQRPGARGSPSGDAPAGGRHGPERPSRRTRPSRRRGAAPPAARIDLRGTMRASLRTGGDPFERHWREPGERPRPLVLVCDVSGSMEPYARMLLAYMQACVAARRRVEAFVFGTRLTRVTAELRGRDPDAALAPRRRAPCRTGRAARASASRWPR